MKIITIIGARPQFVKCAMVSRQMMRKHNVHEIIVHTGQHYDKGMSNVFFQELGIKDSDYNLGINGGTHGSMTGRMIEVIEKVILKEKPDCTLVYGDTNSTLAGSLASSKIQIPVVHVEAGLRSFNKTMPEEINRVLTDHLSTILLCPTSSAVDNLRNEGIGNGVYHVGDVMFDAAITFGEIAQQKSKILSSLGLTPESYRLATVHRAENTDNPLRLRSILEALSEISTSSCPVVLPLHPRTLSCIEIHGLNKMIKLNPSLRVIKPVSFFDMIMLEKNSICILTDSGGVQKEAYFHGIPCITLRDETEWVETVSSGWNQICGANKLKIIDAVQVLKKGDKIMEFGNGKASALIVDIIMKELDN